MKSKSLFFNLEEKPYKIIEVVACKAFTRLVMILSRMSDTAS